MLMLNVYPNSKYRMNTIDVENETPTMAYDAAVLVRGATKIYGSGTKAKIIFENLNMTVKRGTIYGLLGASGCGKTTLLSCVVGIKELNSGDIWVLGGKPGTPGSGVPGPRIGFMPQDISLISEFTVKGAVYYFGRLFELSNKKIAERFDFLSKLLDLPPPHRYIKNCSGGQQRRVSFAAAMVHEPELLILDEPTVGLDPVLRDNIWNHLVDITVKQGTAVIITTHYIEETKKANCIGLMRGGILMAEESPERLIELFHVETLEEVFLNLSERQSRGEVVPEFESVEYRAGKRSEEEKYSAALNPVAPTEDNINSHSSTFSLVNNNELPVQKTSVVKLPKPKQKYKPYSSGRLKALFIKNMHQILRNRSGLCYAFMFPIMEMISFFLGVGTDPKYLTLAVVNNESSWQNCVNYTSSYPTVYYYSGNDTCDFRMLSCRFLNSIDDFVAVKVFYDDLETAKQTVVNGSSTALMYFAKNYTEATKLRIYNGLYVDEHDVESGEIQVWVDMSNRQVGGILQKNLYDIYRKYEQDIFRDCNISEKFSNPINFEKPVYGKADDPYLVFMYPAVLVTLIYFMSTSVTCTTIIVDRLEGVWDRSLVAGVTHGEILVTHFISQFFLIFIQIITSLFVAMVMFQMECKGNFMIAFALIILQGINGMLNGFFTSITCRTISLANYAVTGSFLIMILICGLIWPLEGMPTPLRWFSLCLPFTVPILSFRDILLKGWSFENFEVSLGFIVSFTWFIIYIVTSYLLLRKKN